MGRVWLIVLASMCFTLGASWIWHLSGMNGLARKNNAERERIVENTSRITAYRDVLKEEGAERAKEDLKSQYNTYGN